MAILIIATELTLTPEMFTQLLLAVPMYVVYEISTIVRKTGHRH